VVVVVLLMEALVALEVEVLEGLIQLQRQLLARPTQAAAVVVVLLVLETLTVLLAALVLSSCLYQQPNIREPLRVHQRLRQAGQIQF